MDKTYKGPAMIVEEIFQNLDANTIGVLNVLLRLQYPSYTLLDFADPNSEPVSPALNDCYLVSSTGTVWGKTVEKDHILRRAEADWEILPIKINEIQIASSTHAAAHITGAADEIDGDKLDIDWNPTNYTPATTPTEVDSIDNLVAHLFGIDQALGNVVADIWTPPQAITYSATPTQDFTAGNNAAITLTGDVTTYTLSNVENGGSGEIEITQDAVGGFGVNAFAHTGLTVVYIPGAAPTASNIDSSPNARLIVSFKRMGAYLYIAYSAVDTSLPRTAEINVQTGTTYTLQASDNGKVVTCSNVAAITVTVPAGLGAGFNCTVMQVGAGQVTFSASGTTVNNRNAYTSIAGQYGAATLLSYAADVFLLQGDLV